MAGTLINMEQRQKRRRDRGSDQGAAGHGRLRVRLLAAALLLATPVIAGGCDEHENAYVPPPPPPVTVAAPVRKAMTEYLEFTGNTQAFETVQLRARVEGFLDKVMFSDGDRVRKGQLLFVIQQSQYGAALQEAQANILAEKARLSHAEIEFARYSRLFKQNAAAETDVERWRYERDSARAALQAAEAKTAMAQLNLDYTEIRAPFDGRIDRRLRDPGNLVGAGGEQTVLAEINRIDPIYAYYTINDRELLRVRELQRKYGYPDYRKGSVPVYLQLQSETGYPHEGRVDFAAITVNPETGTLLLRGIFPNSDGSLLPGLFARLRVPIEQRQNAILVPALAVAQDQIGRYVLVVNQDNTVERRSVTVGSDEGSLTVISDGLSGDERVIVGGMLRAIPGRKVSPMPAPASAGNETPAAAHGG